MEKKNVNCPFCGYEKQIGADCPKCGRGGVILKVEDVAAGCRYHKPLSEHDSFDSAYEAACKLFDDGAWDDFLIDDGGHLTSLPGYRLVKEICPKCGQSFDVAIPRGLVVMMFADDSNPEKDVENFVDDFKDAATIRTCYVFNSVADFAAAWRKMVGNPDGMWYFVLYKGKQIMSGACDDGDEDYFKEEMEGWPEG